MGLIVRLLGTGLGLASEAIHAHRSRKQLDRAHGSGDGSPSQPQPSSDAYSSTAAGSSRDPAAAAAQRHDDDDAPPVYVEVADEREADALVKAGKAERLAPGEYPPDKKGGLKEDSDSDSEASTDLDEDDAIWELDDMAQGIAPPPTYDEAEEQKAASLPQDEKVRREEEWVSELVRMAGEPPKAPLAKLPCAVVIPQRRPRQKDRGFVRAYAPVLKDVGIEQDVFLKFLENQDQASKASPWIEVVFLSAGIAGFVPELAAQIVSAVVQVVAGTAKELQSRSRRNTFLDRVNQDLFMPRGLYAMIMAFKEDLPPGRGAISRLTGQANKLFATERLDINQTVKKYSSPDPEMSKLKKQLKDIRLTSGKTVGQLEMPEAAELVFPDIDRAVAIELDPNGTGKGKEKEKETFKDKFKGAGKFVQDYMDKRAQAQYAFQNPNSSLATPSSSRQFASRFSDPNHPANSGSLVALLTGGVVNPVARKQARKKEREERRALKREYKDARRIARGRSPRGPRKQRVPKSKKQSVIKKILQQDVLYLLIVNLPAENEVNESVGTLERAMAEIDRVQS